MNQCIQYWKSYNNRRFQPLPVEKIKPEISGIQRRESFSSLAKIQSESEHSAVTHAIKYHHEHGTFPNDWLDLSEVSTPQHENLTVASHLLSRYEMEDRFASHMPSYSTVGNTKKSTFVHCFKSVCFCVAVFYLFAL
ncbi:hypothetical protein TNCV_627061 [Trichonephila clavipes]|nr:hypothetical protein TNCV_627061 [Trichonephila clavipes]